MKRPCVFMLSIAIVLFASACATHYKTPSAGISFAEIDDVDLRELYEREPESPFPATLAIVRVQDSGYVSLTNQGYGHGRYSVVTTRDIESDADFERIGGLPMVSGVAPVGRLLLPPNASSFRDLRTPAAKLRADLLLVYSVDTTFNVEGKALGPLSMISLGLIPNKKAHVTATVAGALIDVRSGFVYGTVESTSTEEQSATIWSTETAIDGARMRAEEAAFQSFVTEFEVLWSDVIEAQVADRAVSRRQSLRTADQLR